MKEEAKEAILWLNFFYANHQNICQTNSGLYVNTIEATIAVFYLIIILILLSVLNLRSIEPNFH